MTSSSATSKAACHHARGFVCMSVNCPSQEYCPPKTENDGNQCSGSKQAGILGVRQEQEQNFSWLLNGLKQSTTAQQLRHVLTAKLASWGRHLLPNMSKLTSAHICARLRVPISTGRVCGLYCMLVRLRAPFLHCTSVSMEDWNNRIRLG